MVLVEDGQALPGSDLDRAFGGFDLPGQDLQKSRFAGPIGADHPITISLVKGEIDLIE
jgi:hypothetical protein